MSKKIYGYTKDTRVTAIVLDGQAVDPSIVYDGEIRTDTPASGKGLVKQPVPVMGNTTRKSKMPKLEGLGVLRRQPIDNLPVSLAVVVGESNIQYTEQPFDKTDIEVTVTYMNGTSKVLEDADYTVSPSTMPAEAGTCDVVFSYTEKSTTVTAEVEMTVVQSGPELVALAITKDWLFAHQDQNVNDSASNITNVTSLVCDKPIYADDGVTVLSTEAVKADQSVVYLYYGADITTVLNIKVESGATLLAVYSIGLGVWNDGLPARADISSWGNPAAGAKCDVALLSVIFDATARIWTGDSPSEGIGYFIKLEDADWHTDTAANTKRRAQSSTVTVGE